MNLKISGQFLIAAMAVATVFMAPTMSSADEISDLISSDDERAAPIQSDHTVQTRLFSIPAPRGLVVDRNGEPLIQTRASEYLAVRLKPLQETLSAIAALTTLRRAFGESPALAAMQISGDDFTKHWKNRPQVPFPVSSPLTEEEAERLRPIVDSSDYLVLKQVFVREYPAGKSAAHITGYARPGKPFQHGPLQSPENLWPTSEGAEGLERSLDSLLRGEPGLASYIYSEDGELLDVELLKPPTAGDVVVTTLIRPMQELAFEILKENGKPGAFVAIDSLSGDILAMASYPSYDPADFVVGMSVAEFEALQADEDGPLFPKASMGEYPPGSTFKPIVALAAMEVGAVNGPYTRFPSPPSLSIDGRAFKNWNEEDEGYLDVRYALLRSSNTWFYQAGIRAGGLPILRMAESYGFGEAPDIEIPTSSGGLPAEKALIVRQGVANLSIGQGDVLVSPLQLARAMAGLSAGTTVPDVRLVIQTQDPISSDIKTSNATRKLSFLNSRRTDRKAVRDGMWGVVNHPAGTGSRAKHDLPAVYGKTGTAQWAGDRNIAWFSGYVGSNAPRIAFTVMVQGESGETLSGGRSAAPLVGEWVEKVYGSQERFDVETTVTSVVDPFRVEGRAESAELTGSPLTDDRILLQARPSGARNYPSTARPTVGVPRARPVRSN